MGRYGLASGNAYYWISSLPPLFIAQVFGRDGSGTCTESEQVPGLWDSTVNPLCPDSNTISCLDTQYHVNRCATGVHPLCAHASNNRCYWPRHYSTDSHVA